MHRCGKWACFRYSASLLPAFFVSFILFFSFTPCLLFQMTFWHQRYVPAGVGWFCKSGDSLDVKNRQVMLVTVSVFICLFTSLLSAISFVPSKWAQWQPSYTYFLGTLVVLLCSRLTRSVHAVHLLVATMVYYTIHMLCTQGGFLTNRGAASTGLLGCVLCTYLYPDTPRPAIFWSVIFLLANSVAFVAQLKGLIEPQPNSITIGFFAFVASQCLCFALIWFVVHVYNKEVQQRRTMQEEVHLFARLSHEIRTPITAIVGLSEVMMHDDSWWPSLTAEQKCTVSDLAASARRLRSVVNDLLVFSSSANVERSAPVCHSAAIRGIDNDEEAVDFNIREVVDTAVGYHLPQAEQTNLQVYIDIPASMP